MKLGFTGTAEGMTSKQRWTFNNLVQMFAPKEFHHGVCVGADTHAHLIVRFGPWLGKPRPFIVGHPGVDKYGRAFSRGDCPGIDLLLPEKRYLDRDSDIVNATDRLVATPKGFEEEQRSGTWATIRRARKAGKTIDIIWPNGEITTEVPTYGKRNPSGREAAKGPDRAG